MGSCGCALLDVIGTLLALVLSFLAATGSSNLELVKSPLSVALDGGEEASSGGVRTVTEVLCIAASHGLELVGVRALVGLDAVGVKVGLKLRVRPGVKGAVLYSVRGCSEVGSDRGVAGTTRFGGASVAVLSLLEKLITRSSRLVGSLLCSLVL